MINVFVPISGNPAAIAVVLCDQYCCFWSDMGWKRSSKPIAGDQLKSLFMWNALELPPCALAQPQQRTYDMRLPFVFTVRYAVWLAITHVH